MFPFVTEFSARSFMFNLPCDIEQIHPSSPGAYEVIFYFLAFQYEQVIASARLAAIRPLRFNVICADPALNDCFNARDHQVAFGRGTERRGCSQSSTTIREISA